MRLTYDAQTNSLRLMLDEDGDPGSATTRIPGVVDVAANGRLVGVELSSDDGEPAVVDRGLASGELIDLCAAGLALRHAPPLRFRHHAHQWSCRWRF